MIVMLLMITYYWDNQVYRRPSRGGAYHHSLALQFPSFVQVPPFLQSNYSNYIQTIFSVSHYTKKTLDNKQKYPVSTGFGCTKMYQRKYLRK